MTDVGKSHICVDFEPGLANMPLGSVVLGLTDNGGGIFAIVGLSKKYYIQQGMGLVKHRHRQDLLGKQYWFLVTALYN